MAQAVVEAMVLAMGLAQVVLADEEAARDSILEGR